MCYAIPGKVIEIHNDLVIVDYFGEQKKARKDLCEVNIGDYIYAQGGFVINKIPADEALPILEIWYEYFFQLKQTDLNLTREPKNLYQIANAVRQRTLGNACCVHGILEFSNYCQCNCLYCGIRKDNEKILRYRMTPEEIFSACDYAVNNLGFKALVLQSGEDLFYNEKKLIEIVRKIKENCAVLLIVSIGERSLSLYKKIYKEGVRGVLLRFETSNAEIYRKIKPESDLKQRLDLLKQLQQIGYFIITGFLIGLPAQTEKVILDDIDLTKSFNPDMFSFGPFIPHPHTPLAKHSKPSIETILTTIARTRIIYKDAKILVTTALETLEKEGAKQGLLSGANSMMIDITPQKYKQYYEIYPNREGINLSLQQKINKTLKLLESLGRAPTDLGI